MWTRLFGSKAFAKQPPIPQPRQSQYMSDSPDDFLDSVEGEITFFRSVMKARPVGLHKHFHVLAIRNTIHNDTGHVLPVESIWAKLKTCYDLDALETARRIRATASLASSTPAPSPRQPSKSKKTKTTKRSKSKADMAGLVGGDSDSSALTQESGDEGAGITPSVITGTDAGTDYEEDNLDCQSKSARGRVKQLARGGAVGRARAGSASHARGTKKRKK
ncbi:uncharacterized protein EDB91DRAFT_1120266 [Suillus paluster]|uniref:uncharacterized protein n=1 Tax=Suillus paluster TaxID=48578 RepID=UPI001B872881|nr:uncharacterized protein EDB91DRAFT_1120266 [Suillus paluster]KAG1746022.1 hypothetical protein EDB91DRAFT_1120266 [Suillus paluster]